jgi:magnesium and cobalt exporter, CNNM family
MMSARDAFDRLNLQTRPPEGGFHTIAGFIITQLGHLPEVGEHFDYEGWRFEIVDLDGRRIDKVLAMRPKVADTTAS